MTPYRCVRCSSILDDLTCSACRRTYPALSAPGCTIPVHLPNPEAHLYRSAQEIERAANEQRQRIDQIDAIVRERRRRSELLAATRDAMIANADLLLSLRRELPDVGMPGPGMIRWIKGDPAKGLGYVRQSFDYLRQDWGGTPEGEAAIARHVDTVAAQLARGGGERQLGVVLGAGLGRFACEIARHFDEVIALDQSVLMASAYARMHREEITFYEVNERNTPHRADTARRHVASLAHCSPTNIRYCIADGLDVPVADHQVDVIMSVFFTDLVPLTALLAEARRLLKPGGLFIHLGPLGWYFQNIAEWWSVEEAREIIGEDGFEILEEAWLEMLLCETRALLDNTQIRAWSVLSRCR